MLAIEHLPFELQVESLKAAIEERDALLVLRNKVIASQAEELSLLRSQLTRILGNTSRNEPLAPGQGILFGEDGRPVAGELPSPPAQEPEKPKTPSRGNKGRTKSKPSRLELHLLPKVDVYHTLSEAERVCPVTGLPRIKIGEKIVQELDYKKPELRLQVHHIDVYGLADDDAKERKSPTITAPGPVLPFDGCVAGASFIAAILMNKYGDHLPLYRQESIFERYGLFVTRRLSGEWTMRAAELLAPIVSLMLESLYANAVLQLDDTPVRVQSGKGAKHFTGRFWVFGSPETSDVIFRFTRGRSAEGIVDFLRPMQGFLVGDGLQVNKSAADLAGAKVTICGKRPLPVGPPAMFTPR